MADDNKSPRETISLEQAAQMRLLEPKKMRFARLGATLRLTLEDECSFLRVALHRAFPLSLPHRYLSVRDGGEREVGVLVDPELLDPESLAMVKAELERRYFVPEIRRIVNIKEWFGTVDWVVETDRGMRKFTTRNLRESILRPFPNRFILSDVEGSRYDVRDLTALDVRSQEWLLKHV